MRKRPRRQLDYEALAYAAILLGTFDHWRARPMLEELGVKDITSHNVRLFRRAVYRIWREREKQS